jgi:hypothetical protein
MIAVLMQRAEDTYLNLTLVKNVTMVFSFDGASAQWI